MLFILAISLFLNLNTPTRDDLASFLTQKVEHQLAQQYGKDAYRFNVSIKYMPNGLKGVSPEQVTDIELTDPNMPSGYAMAKVQYASGNRSEQDRIQIFVDVWKQLLVPKERIMPGKKLAKDLFELSWVRATRLQGRYLDNFDALKGKVSQRLLPAGKPIPPSGVRSQPIINFGDTVTLQYNENGILFSLSCTARQPGAEGDRIKVYCKDTRKTYEASVINASTVKWEKTL